MRRITTGLLLSPLLGAAFQAQSAPAVSEGEWSVALDALSWRFNDSPVPFPIVTDGLYGEAGTTLLLGNEPLSTGSHRGARLSVGHAFDDRFGIEGNVFGLQSRNAAAGVASSGEIGSIDLILPYIDAATGEEAGSELSQSQIYRGSAREDVQDRLRGAELDLRWSFAAGGSWGLDLLGGVRHLDFRERWTLFTESPYLPAFAPDVWQTTDRFDSRNRFYGVQAGLRANVEAGRFAAAATLKLAAGTMRQSTRVDGFLVTNDFTSFGDAQTFVGGYFAQPSNIGTHSRNRFAMVPQAALDLGYRITDSATLSLGYDFMQVGKVLRPGNQVGRTINTTQSTSFTEEPSPTPSGPLQPDFRYRDSSLRVQGVNLRFSLTF